MTNTLTTKFYVNGEPYTYTTTRNTGESDADFVHRHGRGLLGAMNAIQGATSAMHLLEEDLNIDTLRDPSNLSNADFVTLHVADLLEAV